MSMAEERVYTDHEARIVKMMQGFQQPVAEKPTPGSAHDRQLRFRLIFEELLEYAHGAGVNVAARAGSGDLLLLPHTMSSYVVSVEEDHPADLVEMIDALGDLHVVVTGGFVSHGVPVTPVLAAIDENNLLKIANGHVDPETGKFIKPKNHPKVDLLPILKQYGYEEGASVS